jgi:hypothetical protein
MFAEIFGDLRRKHASQRNVWNKYSIESAYNLGKGTRFVVISYIDYETK